MIVVACIVLGLFVGSFLNVLADRLPKGQDVLWGRSHCDFCKRTLRWYELIPVFSYLIQNGRCRRCHKKLSRQYLLMELSTAFGFGVLSAGLSHSPLLLFAALILFSSFLVIFVADAKYQIIPDSMIVASSIGSLVWVVSTTSLSRVVVNIIAGVVSALLFYLIWLVSRGRGMGFGDVKLSGVLGFFLGFPAIVFALYGAFLTGAGAGVILMVTRQKTLKSKIAFGPFLLLGTGIAIVFNQALLGLWKSIF